MEAETKLQQYIRTHAINMAALGRAVGIASRGDFYNRMTGRPSQSGTPQRFTEEQQHRMAEFLRADISELF